MTGTPDEKRIRIAGSWPAPFVATDLLIVGCGTLGSWAVPTMIRAGVWAKVVLLDPGKFETPNYATQLFWKRDNKGHEVLSLWRGVGGSADAPLEYVFDSMEEYIDNVRGNDDDDDPNDNDDVVDCCRACPTSLQAVLMLLTDSIESRRDALTRYTRVYHRPTLVLDVRIGALYGSIEAVKTGMPARLADPAYEPYLASLMDTTAIYQPEACHTLPGWGPLMAGLCVNIARRALCGVPFPHRVDVDINDCKTMTQWRDGESVVDERCVTTYGSLTTPATLAEHMLAAGGGA